ncbi:uncharacterized protein STEHIDRAFT_126311, partial [Stereum hirsutum FP-91666 SS1]
VHQKCTSPISKFARVTVQKPCVSVTGPVNGSENNVGACKNNYFAQAPAEVTVRRRMAYAYGGCNVPQAEYCTHK